MGGTRRPHDAQRRGAAARGRPQHLAASAVPNLQAYDPSMQAEMAVIIQDGIKRMYQDDEQIFYYLTSATRNYEQLALPAGAEESVRRGGLLQVHECRGQGL